jgi:archaellum component FlaC
LCIECKEEIDRLKHQIENLEISYDKKLSDINVFLDHLKIWADKDREDIDEIISKLRETICDHDFDTEYDMEENPYYVCKKCGYEMRDEDDDDE